LRRGRCPYDADRLPSIAGLTDIAITRVYSRKRKRSRRGGSDLLKLDDQGRPSDDGVAGPLAASVRQSRVVENQLERSHP